jgi:hypothetical protein
MNEILKAAIRLNDYIYRNHWNGNSVTGPDPGVRFNSRIWRFSKSYLSFMPWKDQRYFLQCQGYWIRNNWSLFDILNEYKFRETALACTEFIRKNQHSDGYWEYPLKSWKGRIATVECNYAALGLLETFKRTGDDSLLKDVLKYYNFLIRKIGFQKYQDSLAVNYFANRKGGMVPNNTTLSLELFTEIYNVTQEREFLKYIDKMVDFLRIVQMDSGELPYSLNTHQRKGRNHFLCYQYNGFQFLDLAHVWEITADEKLFGILLKLIRYLSRGLHHDGHAKYSCHKSYPEVPYYTAVLAASFLKATQIGLDDFSKLMEKAYSWLLKQQNPDGGFIYSKRNYGFLSDRRSYPRYLTMILRHLLMKIEIEEKNGGRFE